MIMHKIRKVINRLAVLVGAVGVLGLIFSAGHVVATEGANFDEVCSNLPAGAPTPDYCATIESERGQDSILGENGIMTKVAQTIVFIVGAVSVIMIIIGGLRYVLSGGDSTGTAGAKNTIIYALVGLVVAIFAQVIVSFVLSKL